MKTIILTDEEYDDLILHLPYASDVSYALRVAEIVEIAIKRGIENSKPPTT